jgi:CheY-like chemotaxis protein
MIEQVVTNLAVNACDAMPNGGSLTLTTDTIEIDHEAARFSPDRRPGRFVRLSVTDAGCGMDAATLEHIFEPFFTTKHSGKGTGLGLATVYGIIHQHEGWIEVGSEPGKGSTFLIYLPALPGKSAVDTAPGTAAPPRGGKETILLVEDDANVRKVVALFLRRWGYQVMESTSAREALALWKDHGPQIELFFTDMVMPGGTSGLELARQLRVLRPCLKVIISSGYSEVLAHQNNLGAENITYIAKPTQPRELAAAIRRCLDS